MTDVAVVDVTVVTVDMVVVVELQCPHVTGHMSYLLVLDIFWVIRRKLGVIIIINKGMI